MNKEDYFKYYIQGSDHYLIPKDVFDELFDEMENWKQDTQKYKEVIDKLKNQPTVYLTKYLSDLGFVETKTLNELIEELENDILKEVE